MRFWKTCLCCISLAALVFAGAAMQSPQTASPSEMPPTEKPAAVGNSIQAGEIAPFALKGLDWLIRAQHKDGGWGAGSHAAQQVRDPHKVVTDPATTAFVGLALLRSGSTPVSGPHREALRRATHYLVEAVEKSPSDGPLITDLQGTQPQTKLGPYVDTSITAQYLSRIAMLLPPDDPLAVPADQALDKCLRKLTGAQGPDGSWNEGGGWAPVLQSSLSLNALELAQVAGKKVDLDLMHKAREAQKGNYSLATGRASSSAGAGVELYAYSSAQRAAASDARIAVEAIEKAKKEGVLDESAEVNEENLMVASPPVSGRNIAGLAGGYAMVNAQAARLDDERLLQGFGSNGGEEYLSYLLTSESLIISGSKEWPDWNKKMHQRLAKIQNPDGSWSGLHCITSPVFCTAAVIQCLTADRDAKILLAVANVAAE